MTSARGNNSSLFKLFWVQKDENISNIDKMEQLSVQIGLVCGAMNSWELPKLFKSTSKLHGLIFFLF